MRGLGCLFVLVPAMALAFLEIWVFSLLGTLLDREYFGLLLLLIALSIAGISLLRWRLRLLPQMVLGGGDFGTQAVALLGCVLMILPGFITGFTGLLLQLPIMGRLFGRWCGVVVAAGIRQYASRMGGQFPGGQFPGAGFPGGFPPSGGQEKSGKKGLRPDQRLRGGRTIDVEAEK